MNKCRIVKFDIGDTPANRLLFHRVLYGKKIHNTKWVDEEYQAYIRPVENVKENVLYRLHDPHAFITLHNGELIGLEIPSYIKIFHKQLHDLIEGGLSVYDAFKVMCI